MKIQTKKMGDIFQISGQARAGSESYPIMSITMHHGVIDQSEKFKKRVASINTTNYKIVCKNELVVGFPIDEGVIGFQKKYKQAIVSPAYDIWRLKEGISCSIDFLGRYLRSNTARRIYASKMKGAVARRRSITKDDFLSIQIPFPPLDDQIRIATVLTRAEALIAKRKESIKTLDEFLKSTFLEMFGDPVRNEKGWEKKELRGLGQIITGNTPPRNDDDNYSSKFIEWIKTDNIAANRTFLTIASEYLSEKGFSKARSVTSGALLVACIAGSIESIGRAAIANRQVSFNQQINAIQPNENTDPLFLYWLFKVSKSYIQSHAANGMKKILTKSDFERIITICPPFTLQNQFAAIVQKVESLKTKYTCSYTELENLYSSLSQRAFNGELDLSKVPVVYETEEDVEEIIKTGGNDVELKTKSEFIDEDLIEVIKKYSGKIFSFDEIWKEIETLTDKKIPLRNDLQKRIIGMLESDKENFQQVFDVLSSQAGKYDSVKQIAFRGNYEN